MISDREIDARIGSHLGNKYKRLVDPRDPDFEDYYKVDGKGEALLNILGYVQPCPHYTTSLEDAMGLVEHMIPTYLIQMEWVNGWEIGHLEYIDGVGQHLHLAEDRSLPKAIALAYCKAEGVD